MPTVGTGANKRHFPYTQAGMQMARKEAARTGKPLSMPKKPKGKSIPPRRK